MTTLRDAIREQDKTLLPVLRSACGTPHAAALAVCCKAVAAGHQSSHTRAWLARRAPDGSPLQAIAENTAAWERCWLAARRHVTAVSVHPQRERLAVARRVVAACFRPLDNLAPSRQVAARTAAVAVGLRCLDGEFPGTALVSESDLAVELGTSRLTARSHLALAREAGLITRRQVRKGGQSRYAMTPLRGDAAQALVLDHADVIDALAADDRDGVEGDANFWSAALTAACVRSVAHPAWRYGESEREGRTAWLAAVAWSRGVSPSSVGVRDVSAARQALTARGLGGDDLPGLDGGAFTALLDEYAASTGAAARARAARESREDERAAERGKLETHRRAVSALQRLLDDRPIPRPTAKKATREAWAAGVRARAGDGAPPDLGPAVRAALATRLRRRGYPSEVAVRVAASVVPDRETVSSQVA